VSTPAGLSSGPGLVYDLQYAFIRGSMPVFRQAERMDERFASFMVKVLSNAISIENMHANDNVKLNTYKVFLITSSFFS